MFLKHLGVLAGYKLARKFGSGVAEGVGQAVGNELATPSRPEVRRYCADFQNPDTGDTETVCLYEPKRYQVYQDRDTGELLFTSRQRKYTRRRARAKLRRLLSDPSPVTGITEADTLNKPRLPAGKVK